MQIYLRQFRNIKDKKINLNHYPVFILGKNGSGKTSILEAIYFLSTSKSFRESKKNSLINFGKNIATLELKNHRKLLRVDFKRRDNSKYYVDGKQIARFRFVNQILSEVFWWGDFRMVYGEPEERRRFLNLLCLQIEPIYLQYLSLYKKVMTERKFALLKADLNLLNIWDKKMAVVAEKIYLTRKKTIKLLNLKLAKTMRAIRPKFKNPGIKYKGVFLNRQEFLRKLKNNRQKDLLDFKTHFGPHRDDLDFLWSKRNLKDFSQGEVKSYVLSMKLNFLLNLPKKDKYFLIDDVFAEIDEQVIICLLQMAQKYKIKLILTNQFEPKINLKSQLIKL